MMEKKQNNEKNEKPVKKTEKYIWFVISAVVAVAGVLCRSNDVVFPAWLKIAYAVIILFTIIMAAQKTSTERMKYLGEDGDKQKNILISILYYVFIIVAVLYVFLSLWVSEILSI